jgi:ribosomal protein RSM22 (predicted rRNA methylase)
MSAVDTRLPPALRSALEALSEGRGRRDLAQRSRAITGQYRGAAPSAGVVTAEADALAYALTRMPATYAALARVLAELRHLAPKFAPATMLDAGAGPGTASWAATEAFPASLAAISMLDSSPTFRGLAARLAAAGDGPLATAAIAAGELTATAVLGDGYDLVVAAYALTELPDVKLLSAVEALWRACSGVLVLVEPGRPREYQRLMAARSTLLGQGARMVAPCPHTHICPLPEGDWCHFAVRLARSRDHMRLKSGELPYEDEKFCYLVLARPEISTAPTPARVIRPPRTSKHDVTLPLCTPAGLVEHGIAKRDGPAYKAARKLAWGDAAD